jgi:phospholipid-binding lipoprotein MlaA
MLTGWRQRGAAIVLYCCVAFSYIGLVQAQDLDEDLLNDNFDGTGGNSVSDPLEPLNRAFFQFNDTFYFWVLKPVSRTYATVLPEDVRMCIGNAFKNLTAPVRIVNNLLQGKVADSGIELSRFLINTTIGSVGLGDPAQSVFHLNPKTEDLGQTLGKWGMGEGIYICWPILGPSNLRDTAGLVGDTFLNPMTYVYLSNERVGFEAKAGEKINTTSFKLGDYEQFKEATFDPYTAMRDFYYQSRRSKIADNVRQDNEFSENTDHSGQPSSKRQKFSADMVAESELNGCKI